MISQNREGTRRKDVYQAPGCLLLKVVGIRITSIRLRGKDCENLNKTSNLES